MTNETPDQLVNGLRQTIIAMVRSDDTDLSSRQLGVFLTVYLVSEQQTVRGLAAALNVSKPAITRALDRLAEFDYIRRKTDPLDRRSVFIQRTGPGTTYLRQLKHIVAVAHNGDPAHRVKHPAK